MVRFLVELYKECRFWFFPLVFCFALVVGLCIFVLSVSSSEDCKHYFQSGAFCKNCGDMLQSFCQECGAALK